MFYGSEYARFTKNGHHLLPKNLHYLDELTFFRLLDKPNNS